MTGLSNVTREGGRERERHTDKEGMRKGSVMLQKRGEAEREECVCVNKEQNGSLGLWE